MIDTSLLSFLIDRYGFRLTTADLAWVLKTTPAEIRNQICAGTFPIRTAKTREGRSAPRYADVRDVADYLDATRPQAISVPKKLAEKQPKNPSISSLSTVRRLV